MKSTRQFFSASITSSLFFIVFALATVFFTFIFINDAAADLRLCNRTSSKISVAIGYKNRDVWTTEGWWNFSPTDDDNACKVVLPGALTSRFYYVYAMDITKGGEWGGNALLCTQPREFTISGIENCVPRGFEQTGFFEVDTGQQESWTVQLTDPQNEETQR